MATIKLKDIADQLGISRTTVSRALTGNGRVKKETHDRVMQLARESNYMVNSIARSLRLNDARFIGVVVPDISNSFFSSIIKGVQKVCREHKYMLMVCNSDEDERYEEEALKTLLEKQISGLIVASVGGCPAFLDKHPGINVPVVYIDNVPEGANEYDLVSIDNYSAASLLTHNIVKHGYREIGMISGPRNQSSALMRYKGFLQALNECSINANEKWIYEGDFTVESGYNCMKEILSNDYLPRAMLFANNNIAYGAVRAILEQGIHIPDKMAVASFDTYDHTGLVTPQIVSINQPAEEIGTSACERIIERLTNQCVSSGRHVFLEPFFTDGNSW